MELVLLHRTSISCMCANSFGGCFVVVFYFFNEINIEGQKLFLPTGAGIVYPAFSVSSSSH